MILFPNITPEIFTVDIFGLTLSLRWYALSYIFGFLLALLIMKTFIRKQVLWKNGIVPLSVEQADSLITYLILGVIVGGRVGYVLFYNLDYYLLFPANIFKLWDGGMSFHGGFLGVIISVILFCRVNSINLWSCADLIALASAPGLFLGRLANFINAELWGKPTTMAWGVVFPGDAAQNCPNIIGLCARHPTQLYEAALEGALLFLVLFILAKKGFLRLPKFITGCFGVGYGAARYIVEFYRVPDPQFFSTDNQFGYAFKYGEFGLTMGQALSIPMIIVGLFLIFFSLLRHTDVGRL